MTVDPYEVERQRSLEAYERKQKKVLRVADTDRDRAVNQLRQHLADGRLDMDEFTERVDQVLTARTNAEIDVALHELPFVSIDPAKLASIPVPGHHGRRPAPPPELAVLRARTVPYVAASTGALAVGALALLLEGELLPLFLLVPVALWGVWLLVAGLAGRRDDGR